MNAVNETFDNVRGMIPSWMGFLFGLAAGAAALIVGAILPHAGLIAFGVAGIAGTIIAWVSGAVASPEGNPFTRSFGATMKRIPALAWLVIFGLFAVAAVITIVTR